MRPTYIAARIGCSVSTISRELDRNKGKKGYRHKKAQGMAQHRIAVKAAKWRKFTDKMWKLFKEKLREGWTPQMVVGRCRRDGIPKDMLKACTFDGKEFAFFKQLEQALGIKVYFAKPYHSWKRGTNENRNGGVVADT